MIGARAVIGVVALLISSSAVAQAANTTVVVYVHKGVQESQLSIQYPKGPPIPFGPPISSAGAYRTYRTTVEWPVGNRDRRNDLALFARLQTNGETAVYLRLRKGVRNTEVYIFSPSVQECEQRPVYPPLRRDNSDQQQLSVESAFEQVALAEAMLQISDNRRKCGRTALDYWTRVWIRAVANLQGYNKFVRINSAIVQRIRSAYSRFWSFPILGRRLTPPSELNRIVALEQRAAQEFSTGRK